MCVQNCVASCVVGSVCGSQGKVARCVVQVVVVNQVGVGGSKN